MTEEDASYYLFRAEQEIYSAEASDHPGVVRAHYLMAGFYLDRVYGIGVLPCRGTLPEEACENIEAGKAHLPLLPR